MNTHGRWIALALLVGAAVPLAVPTAARAQSRPISVWVGAGRPVARDSVSLSLRNLDAHGAVQVDLPLLPVALRGDLTFAGGDLQDGTRNAIVSAVFPLRLPIVQPYAMVGYGAYDWGKPAEVRGVSIGAGVRLHLGAIGLFAQLRRHDPLDRSVGTVGIVF